MAAQKKSIRENLCPVHLSFEAGDPELEDTLEKALRGQPVTLNVTPTESQVNAIVNIESMRMHFMANIVSLTIDDYLAMADEALTGHWESAHWRRARELMKEHSMSRGIGLSRRWGKWLPMTAAAVIEKPLHVVITEEHMAPTQFCSFLAKVLDELWVDSQCGEQALYEIAKDVCSLVPSLLPIR